MRRAMTQPQKPKGLILQIQQQWSILLVRGGGGPRENKKPKKDREARKTPKSKKTLIQASNPDHPVHERADLAAPFKAPEAA